MKKAVDAFQKGFVQELSGRKLLLKKAAPKKAAPKNGNFSNVEFSD